MPPAGLHTVGSGAFRLDGYLAQDHEMIGAPGATFKAIMREINGARIYVAAMCCGMMQSTLRRGRRRMGRSAHTFGSRSHEHQGWRWTLAEASSSLAAARRWWTPHRPRWTPAPTCRLIAAQTKIVATRMVERHLPAVVHAMGAEGLKPEHGLGRHLAGVAGLQPGRRLDRDAARARRQG